MHNKHIINTTTPNFQAEGVLKNLRKASLNTNNITIITTIAAKEIILSARCIITGAKQNSTTTGGKICSTEEHILYSVDFFIMPSLY